MSGVGFDWFRPWDPAWIVHEDAELLVIDKPAGVASQAADPARPDDAPSRLRAYLGARDGREPYLGVHQRLDQATSGLLVYSKDRAVNPALSQAFESRKVTKRYLALVSGWRGEARTLDDHLGAIPHAPAKGARRQVVPKHARGAERAITHVEVRARQGRLALLSLRLETGRMHQARVQLAAAGAPIVGDRWYGGLAAPRLCLHAAQLELPLARRRRFEAKSPIFTSWLSGPLSLERVYDDDELLALQLQQAAHPRYWLGRPEHHPESARTEMFRWVHGEGDGLPELAIDVYGRHAHVQLYGTDGVFADERRVERLLSVVARGFDGVYKVVRPKQANVLVSTRREDLAPKHAVRGDDLGAEGRVVLREEGLPVEVRLGDGLATGVYLDQRLNRAWVRAESKGLRVLNLFAYTALFSVAAALGEAAETVSVDASAVALEIGRQNFQNAGVWDEQRHRLVAEDVFAWLARMQRRGQVWDLIICDPPAYSNTKKRRFSTADGGWIELCASCLSVLAPGGRLLAFTNHRQTSRARFRKHLTEGAAQAGVALRSMTDRPDPIDYPIAPPSEPKKGARGSERAEAHLKGVLLVRG